MSDSLVAPAKTPAVGERFEDVVLPHLNAGYRLARWLTRNDHDAEDVVQEASLRAFRYFRTFTGGNGRAWFLRIVRNTCGGSHAERRHVTDPFDEEQHSSTRTAPDPEMLMLRADAATIIERALLLLPTRFREVIVLRELEGLSYRELADVMDVPIGTVMSSLSRARRELRDVLLHQTKHSGILNRTQVQEEEPDTILV